MKKKSLFLFVFFACKLAMAQTAATNTGILYIIGSSDIFYAGSDFTNNSGSALTNNGQLHVKGTLSNGQSSMTIGTGTLYLNGSSSQAVNGSQAFKTYHLNTNNSSGITLNNNLSVSGTHTFTSGIITTSATPNYLIYEAGSSYTGDGDSKHVNGWVKKFGSSNFAFPVGDATYERTVSVSSLSASSEFNAKYYTITPNTGFINMQVPLSMVDPSEYWAINKVSGGNAIVTLNWDNSKVYFPNWILPDITVAGYNGSLWTSNGVIGTATGNVATTGTISSASLSSFNLFTPGSTSWILSQTLISFTAYKQNNFTKIEWITEKELNTDRYIVERSDDGSYFYTIGQLAARNSGTKEQYNTRDNAPINKIAYYRLRIVNADGRESLSRIVTVSDDNKNGQLQLLSNPVYYHQVTLIASQQLNGLFNYVMTSMNGQIVQQGKLQIQNGGAYQIELTRKILPGAYMLNVSNGLETFQYKLVVQ